MADVAISCLAARYCKMLINIEYLRCSMSIGLYKFELQCWRFPRQGFALPRNDILDGAVQQCDKHQFDYCNLNKNLCNCIPPVGKCQPFPILLAGESPFSTVESPLSPYG